MNKILIIEDDKLVRDSVSLSLESAGYVVMEAASWEEGIRGQRQFDPSVIISDVVSLECKGGELLRTMGQLSTNIPLITLMGTVSDSGTTAVPAERPAPDHALQKPFTIDELLATVENALLEKVS